VRLPRPVYALLRLGEAIGSSISRAINGGLLGGSNHQSISARAFVEPGWHKWQRRIDALFFLRPGHCERAWAQEVLHARKVLRVNRAREISTSPMKG
jgi:hypothetical protein